jgi:hypothetical protein
MSVTGQFLGSNAINGNGALEFNRALNTINITSVVCEAIEEFVAGVGAADEVTCTQSTDSSHRARGFVAVDVKLRRTPAGTGYEQDMDTPPQ